MFVTCMVPLCHAADFWPNAFDFSLKGVDVSVSVDFRCHERVCYHGRCCGCLQLLDMVLCNILFKVIKILLRAGKV